MSEKPTDATPAQEPGDDDMDAEFIPNPRLYGHETQASLHAEMREEEEAGKNMHEIIALLKRKESVKNLTGAAMTTEERIREFSAMIRDQRENSYRLEDADGEYRLWAELSPAGKLGVLAHTAAFCDAPFAEFARAARETLPPDAALDVCMEVLLEKQNQLTAIDRLLPDDGRTEPTPIVEQVENLMLDHESLKRAGPVQVTPTRTTSEEPKRVDWRAADMRGANLAGMDLEGVDFRAADLRGVNFSNSMLRNADFRGALLDGANFQNANLYGAKMQGVEAGQADFRGADLRCVNFGGAYLLGAMMPVPSADQEAFRRVLEGKTEAAEPVKDKQPDRTNGR